MKKPILSVAALALVAAGMAFLPEQIARAQDKPAAAATPAAPAEDVDADSVILDRQLVMQQLDKDSAEIGKMLAGEIKPTKIVEVTQSIAKSAKESYESFKPKVPGGSAKPEVWTNWADFSARMEKFVAKSDEMAKDAAKGGLPAVYEVAIDALPCQDCHDHYRVPKKDK